MRRWQNFILQYFEVIFLIKEMTWVISNTKKKYYGRVRELMWMDAEIAGSIESNPATALRWMLWLSKRNWLSGKDTPFGSDFICRIYLRWDHLYPEPSLPSIPLTGTFFMTPLLLPCCDAALCCTLKHLSEHCLGIQQSGESRRNESGGLTPAVLERGDPVWADGWWPFCWSVGLLLPPKDHALLMKSK